MMFLIPVVPGPAVYLTAGVLVVPLGKSSFLAMDGADSGNTFDACNPTAGTEEGTAWAFWASCAVACALSFTLKLVAHVLQQKLIGENQPTLTLTLTPTPTPNPNPNPNPNPGP